MMDAADANGTGGASAKAPSKAKASARSAAGKDDAAAQGGGTSVSMSTKKAGDGVGEALAASASSGDVFARSIAMMALAHIARGAGFDAVQRSAGDALVDILAKYIQRIGVSAKEIAELAGRTQPRATDVMHALNDLEPAPVELKDLIKALETAKRPFPRDVPSFPVRKRDVAGNTIEQTKIGNREDLPAYVPSFLPALPNRHTYSSDSRVVVDREQDTKRTRLDMLGQKSQVQQSLHGLQSAFARKALPQVHQPSWNAFQGSTGENASENPFVQPAVVLASTPSAAAAADKKSVFASIDREFAPNPVNPKEKKKSLDQSAAPLSKMSSNQELGKEEKILTGTFHDGDSE
ncbi:TPA: hypothetical protein N0F65_002779 [Lagenidium giganteum]|uniref:Transcription initiation factor TFIID subunit 8 n=1 Tax=Lagenidium giganteum TaxID=4803 RepID=A0AAV2YJ48_9STRA|nr:TPA: hypothetical protein N0F65_002779 [Lagenidium giganteum]